jgi:hypothetical protein
LAIGDVMGHFLSYLTNPWSVNGESLATCCW